MPEELHIRIRKAKANDISAIASIEQQLFPNPWQKSYFTHELSHDISYFYAAEDHLTHQVAGYIIFWIIEDLLELHKIVTAKNYKKKGIGKQLFLFMLRIARQKKVKDIFLEVRKSNTEAIKFYESFHFELAGIREAYYHNPAEDALIYRLKFDSFLKK
ncbi:MAG: ribosomal protein S18-alanine N-acetyltransferase [Candidatus Aminicenantes bacterium]|jgi:ribosomal-protein-alanine N-acetyltransferase